MGHNRENFGALLKSIIGNLKSIIGSGLNVTGPGKTGLIYTKYMCSYYGTYLLFCMCYPKSVNFIEFLMDFCIYDDILGVINIIYKMLLHFKLLKSSKILRVDKTCFLRPSQIKNRFHSNQMFSG